MRRLVGYGRLSGIAATQALARLYATSRLYNNFFQPSFKLKSKRRDVARVSKTYYPPSTPFERLQSRSEMDDSVKAWLRAQFEQLDPVHLLREIRSVQQVLADFAAHGTSDPRVASKEPTVTSFLEGLATAWQLGEVRPTHCRQPGARHWWKTRADPFEQAWPLIEQWLAKEPTVTARELMDRLAKTMPDV